MKNYVFLTVLLQGWLWGVTAASYTLSQTIDSLSVRYDRIATYHAEADIFEHDG